MSCFHVAGVASHFSSACSSQRQYSSASFHDTRKTGCSGSRFSPSSLPSLKPVVSTNTLNCDRHRITCDFLAEGAVVRRRVTSGEIASALANAGAGSVKLDWPLGSSDDLYISNS